MYPWAENSEFYSSKRTFAPFSNCVLVLIPIVRVIHVKCFDVSASVSEISAVLVLLANKMELDGTALFYRMCCVRGSVCESVTQTIGNRKVGNKGSEDVIQ